jgi:hypothetical protein
MRALMGWKIATFVLAGSTLVLAGMLLVEPRAAIETSSSCLEPAAGAEDDDAPQLRRRVEVRAVDRATMKAVTADRASSTTDVAAELASQDVLEVCQRLLFGRFGGPKQATHADLMTRLRRDEGEAAATLGDWLRRRHEIRHAEVGVAIGGPIAVAYAEVLGPGAAPLLGEILFETHETWALIGLIKTGDPVSWQRIDDFNRRTYPDGAFSPSRCADAGERGHELLRGWAFDDGVHANLAWESRKLLWSRGTDDDRVRVLDVMTPERALALSFGLTPRWERWAHELRDIASRFLREGDPWLRLHGSQHVLRNSYRLTDELVELAIAVGEVDCELPNPGGRDATRWATLQRDVRGRIETVRKKRELGRRRREVLGLNETR